MALSDDSFLLATTADITDPDPVGEINNDLDELSVMCATFLKHHCMFLMHSSVQLNLKQRARHQTQNGLMLEETE